MWEEPSSAGFLLADNDSQYHNELIIDQFTKQAIPFTQNAAHSAEYAVKRPVTLCNVSKKDTVLDVACGRIGNRPTQSPPSTTSPPPVIGGSQGSPNNNPSSPPPNNLSPPSGGSGGDNGGSGSGSSGSGGSSTPP